MEHYYTENSTVGHDLATIEYRIGEGVLTLTTDAGVFSKKRVDFGSMLLIKTVPTNIEGTVLDMGCGYGPIGLSIAYLNPNSKVTMVDINNRAVDLAKLNAKSNHVTNVEVIQSDGYSNVTGSFDRILSNPPIRTGKKVIYPLFEKSYEYLNRGGEFYIVIQKKQGAESAKKKIQEVYGNCDVVVKDAGYWILRAKKENELSN